MSLNTRLRSLQSRVDAIRHSDYFSDEAEAYDELKKLVKHAQRLRVVSLANTHIVHLFEEYRQALVRGCQIDILFLDPTDERQLQALDRLVSVAAHKTVLPNLRKQVEKLSIGTDTKAEVERLTRNGETPSATKRMIQASILIWSALIEEAEKTKPQASRFLKIQFYRCPPTLKGWIIGDDIVLKGDFSIPGYGLTQPQILFETKRAPSEVKNFIYSFHLLWTDNQTQSFRSLSELSTASGKSNQAADIDRFAALAGSFYETSGREAIQNVFQSIHFHPAAKVVDLGAGTGHLSIELSRRVGPQGQVLYVENDKRLVDAFSRSLEARNWPEHSAAPITPLLSDVETLNVLQDSVDYVFARHSLHHFPRPEHALREVWRCLKPGGAICLIEVISQPDPESRQFINLVANASNPANIRYYSIDELREMLENCGFVVQTMFECFDYKTPLRDYERRCRTRQDYERLGDFFSLLKAASPGLRQNFRILGGAMEDITITLPEVAIVAAKVENPHGALTGR